MDSNNSSVGWILAIVAFVILIIVISFNSMPKNDSKSTRPAYTTTNTTTTTTTPTKTVKAKPVQQEPRSVTWSCIDATSYNKNPYDDNLCTSSTGEVKYVSDSQARALDPSYTPGTSGHPYYNSK